MEKAYLCGHTGLNTRKIMDHTMKQHTHIYPLVCLASLWLLFTACSQRQVYSLADYGLLPDQESDSSPLLRQALEQIAKEVDPDQPCTIVLPKGLYHLYPESATELVY